MVWTRPSAKGLRGKQACPEDLQQKRAGCLLGGPSRSRVCGCVWRVGGRFFFLFPGPCLLQFIFLLSEHRLLIGWVSCYIRERQPIRAGLWLSPCCRLLKLLQTGTQCSQTLLFPGQSREEQEDSELNDRAGTSWGLSPGPTWSTGTSLPSTQVHFSLSIWLLKPIWMSVGYGKGKNQGAEMLAVTRFLYFKWWLELILFFFTFRTACFKR